MRTTSDGPSILKNRRAALKNWRKKQVRDWLQCDDDARRFHDNASADLRESILEGDIPLAGLAEQVAASRQERDARHVAARLESKARLAQSQRAALQDCDGTEHGFTVPGFLAILETGEVGLFRRRHTCVEWARASGGAFLLGNFEQSSFRMHLGPSVD